MVAACIILLIAYTRPRPTEGAQLALVINLDRNKARLDLFANRYDTSDLARVPLYRVRAVDGRQEDWSRSLSSEALERLMTVQKTGFRSEHPELTPGAVGCYLSHMHAWSTVINAGVPYALVFEDDAAIPEDAHRKFQTALKSAPPDWDIILLGYAGRGTLISPVLSELQGFLLLHAYAISAKAARSLCATMLPITRQIDWELSYRIHTHGLRVYGLHPSLIKQHWQGTDIQIPLKPKSRAPAELTVRQPFDRVMLQ